MANIDDMNVENQGQELTESDAAKISGGVAQAQTKRPPLGTTIDTITPDGHRDDEKRGD